MYCTTHTSISPTKFDTNKLLRLILVRGKRNREEKETADSVASVEENRQKNVPTPDVLRRCIFFMGMGMGMGMDVGMGMGMGMGMDMGMGLGMVDKPGVRVHLMQRKKKRLCSADSFLKRSRGWGKLGCWNAISCRRFLLQTELP